MNIIFIIISILFILSITYYRTIPLIETQSISLVEQTADDLSSELSNIIENSKQIARGLSFSSSIQFEDASNIDDNAIKKELNSYLNANPSIHSAYITHYNGSHTKVIILFRETENSDTFISDVIFDKEFAQDEVFLFLLSQVNTLEKGIVINSPAYFDTAFVNKPMISLLAPIVINGTNYGFTGVDIIMDSVISLIDEIPQILGNNSYGIIVDIDETILAHPSDKWNFDNNWDRDETLKLKDWAGETTITDINEVVNASLKDETLTLLSDDYIITVNLIESTGWNLIIISPDSLIYDISTQFTISGIIAGTVSWILFGAITYYYNRYKVGDKIINISDLAKKISLGDLTNLIEDDTNIDELSELTNSFNTMSSYMKNLILNMKQTSSLLSSNSQELFSATEEINASAEEVASTSQAMSDGATSQTELIADVNENILELQNIVDNIVKKIQLNTQEVSQIALQTNILALNAGIEASRAGDYGRGFAVVAENVRKLSDQSKIASERIEIVAVEIKDTLLSAFNRISNTMINVVSVSEETAASSEEVAAAAEEMTATIEQISSSALTLTKNAEKSDEIVSHFIINK